MVAVTGCACPICLGLGELGSLPALPMPQAYIYPTSGVYEVDALLGGDSSRWNAGSMYGKPVTLTFSFMDATPGYYSGQISGFQAFADPMKAAARDVLAKYSAVANINFVEVSNTGSGGQIRFGMENAGSGLAAYAYLPTSLPYGGDVWLNTATDENYNLTPGTYGYSTLLHEVGHAVGLKHPGNYNSTGGGTDGPYLSAAADNTDNTVMSYNDGDLPYPTDLRPYDVMAVQFLYGPRTAKTIGRLTAGNDASDTFYGDSRNNSLIGNGGSDTLSGGSGDDGLLGGIGSDLLLGDSGNDLIYGNQDTDTLYGGTGSDTLFGGQGADAVYGDSAASDLSGSSDLIYANMADDTIYAGVGDDTLYGGLGNDQMYGGDGSDYLIGNMDNDTMSGGAGGDRFYFGSRSGADVITDFTRYQDYLCIQRNVNSTAISSFADVVARTVDVGGNAVIDLGGGNSITLLGFSRAQLISADVWIY